MRIAKPGEARPWSAQIEIISALWFAWPVLGSVGRKATSRLVRGVYARTVKNVEADRRKPRSETQAKISDALANAGADLDGDCSVRIRGDARSTPSAVVETSSECRP